MAPAATNTGASTNTSEDHTIPLINASVATTTLAVNSKLESLLNVVTSPSTGNTDIDGKLDSLRADLDLLTTTQSTEQEEIKRLLEEALNAEVLQHLTKEIELQIDKHIDSAIAGLVEEELNNYIPRELRKEVDDQRTDIQRLQVQIHNSEARRANSVIRTPKQFGENLHHLINARGAKSDIFPGSVRDLLEFDDVKIIELVRFYGMEHPDLKSKIPNLNWFLRNIGVAYQSNFLG